MPRVTYENHVLSMGSVGKCRVLLRQIPECVPVRNVTLEVNLGRFNDGRIFFDVHFYTKKSRRDIRNSSDSSSRKSLRRGFRGISVSIVLDWARVAEALTRFRELRLAGFLLLELLLNFIKEFQWRDIPFDGIATDALYDLTHVHKVIPETTRLGICRRDSFGNLYLKPVRRGVNGMTELLICAGRIPTMVAHDFT